MADQAEPVLSAIHIAPGSRLPMKSQEEATIEVDRGITGDRYSGAPHRQVSVVSAEELRQAEAVLGQPIPPGATRRNLTISSGIVPQKPGDRIVVGVVELEVVRPATPCRILDEEIGPGAEAAVRGRAGAHCRVLKGGEIRLNDPVSVITRT